MRGRGNGGGHGGGGGGGGHPHSGGGHGRKPHLPLRLQTFDSNGPEVRIRGNAYQVYEKYLQLARDAAAAGDRIAAENYLQHAEHYFRIINMAQAEGQAGQPNAQGQRPPHLGGAGFGMDEQEGGPEGEQPPTPPLPVT
jgi:hypothetical protein